MTAMTAILGLRQIEQQRLALLAKPRDLHSRFCADGSAVAGLQMVAIDSHAASDRLNPRVTSLAQAVRDGLAGLEFGGVELGILIKLHGVTAVAASRRCHQAQLALLLLGRDGFLLVHRLD